MGKKSLKRQIAAALAVLAGVFILMVLGLGFIYFRYGMQKYESEIRVISDQYADLLSQNIHQARSQIDNYFTTSPYYQKIAAGNTFDYEWAKGVYHIKADLTTMSGTLPVSGGFFFYDRYRNAFFSAYHDISGDLISLNCFLKDVAQAEYTGRVFYGTQNYSDMVFLVYYLSLNGNPLGFVLDLTGYLSVDDELQVVFYTEGEGGPVLLESSGNDLVSLSEATKLIERGGGKGILDEQAVVFNEISEFPGLHMMTVSRNKRTSIWSKEGFLTLFVLLPLIFIAMYLYFLRVLRQTLLNPVTHLNNSLKQVQESDEPAITMPESRFVEYSEINGQIDRLIQQITFLREEQLNEQLRTKEALLQYYQAQTDPHFFLSCLNTVSSLLENGKEDVADRLILALSSHFRYMFRGSKTLVTVREEVEAVQHYCDIYQIRKGFPVLLSCDIQKAAESFQIPLLSIMTYVENSVKHSNQQASVLSIRVAAEIVQENGRKGIVIRVTDNGPGYPEEVLKDLNKEVESYEYTPNKVGISNLKYRLRLLYGDRVQWWYYNLPYGGAAAELKLLEICDECADN